MGIKILEEAKNTINKGECIVYPTETVYGLGVDALDPMSIKRAYEAKNRDYSKPMSMAVPDIDTVKKHIYITEKEKEFMSEFLPGPVTVICNKKDHVPDVLTSETDKVGIRIPNYKYTLQLLNKTGPITSTSANISGSGSVVNVANLSDEFIENIETIVDDGILSGGTGSTVVDVSESKIHRQGAISKEVSEWLDNN